MEKAGVQVEHLKILLLSDSHGRTDKVLSVVDRNKKNITCVIHLGDYARDIKAVENAYPSIITEAVQGNNDGSSEYPLDKVLMFSGKRILLTHGHTYKVGRDLMPLAMKAKQENAGIAVFGHTHIPLIEEKDGIYLINPGCLFRPRSLMGPTYSLLEISEFNIHADIYSY